MVGVLRTAARPPGRSVAVAKRTAPRLHYLILSYLQENLLHGHSLALGRTGCFGMCLLFVHCTSINVYLHLIYFETEWKEVVLCFYCIYDFVVFHSGKPRFYFSGNKLYIYFSGLLITLFILYLSLEFALAFYESTKSERIK